MNGSLNGSRTTSLARLGARSPRGSVVPLVQSIHTAGAGMARRLAPAGAAPLLGVMLVLLLSLSACETATRAAGSLLGRFGGERGRYVIVVHRGFASLEWLRDKLDPVITTATTEGATVKLYILDGGSAAGMTEVRFSDAAGAGSFMPTGKNPDAWSDEAESFRAAALRDVVAALTARGDETDGTGADLLGALRHAVSEASAMPGEGDPQAIVISGGGVNRTEALDLVSARATPRRAPKLAHRVAPVDPRAVAVELIGIGRFEGLDPPVDPVFASGVTRFWQLVCPACVIR